VIGSLRPFSLKEWEIRATYSTYLSGALPDLPTIARRLVECDLAEAVYQPDGRCVYRDNAGAVRESRMALTVSDRSAATISFEPSIEAEFAHEALIESGLFRYSELRLLPNGSPLVSDYLRAQIGAFVLAGPASRFHVRATIKLHSNGVCITEFRFASPDHDVDLATFVSSYVNSFSNNFDETLSPVGLAKLAPLAGETRKRVGFWERWRTVLLAKGHEQAIDETKGDTEEGELAPLALREEEGHETFDSLAETIALTVGYAISTPRSGWSYAILGQKQLATPGYWVGRPHIYIISHSDQERDALKNERRHGKAFGWIMARVAPTEDLDVRQYLPASLRKFADFGFYINKSISLCVHSTNSRERAEALGPMGRAQLIFDCQVQAEVLDYVYMLTMKLSDRVSQPTARMIDVVGAQAALVEAEAAASRTSRFGDVEELLQVAWERYGLPELRDRISRTLETRRDEVALAESRSINRWGTGLALVLGASVIPSLSHEVLPDLWRFFGWAVAERAEVQRVVWLGISTGIVALLLLPISYLAQAPIRRLAKKARSR